MFEAQTDHPPSVKTRFAFDIRKKDWGWSTVCFDPSKRFAVGFFGHFCVAAAISDR
jgi:hypothetical protein